eukprot:365889-Chlamydomonas_euryale.AAC.2
MCDKDVHGRAEDVRQRCARACKRRYAKKIIMGMCMSGNIASGRGPVSLPNQIFLFVHTLTSAEPIWHNPTNPKAPSPQLANGQHEGFSR